MTIAVRLSELSERLSYAERYAIEIYLTLCSLWAAWALWGAPSNFAAYRGSYLWLASLEPNERHWAILVLVGGLSKALGLVCCLRLRAHGIGLALRVAGLGISGFFWVAMGGSVLLGNPDTLAGFPMLLMGISAWWTLLRFPATPRPS